MQKVTLVNSTTDTLKNNL